MKSKAQQTFEKLANLTHEWRDELNRDEYGASDVQKVIDREQKLLKEYNNQTGNHTLAKVFAGLYTVPALTAGGFLGGGLLGAAASPKIPRSYRKPAVRGVAGLGALVGAGAGLGAAQIAGNYFGNSQEKTIRNMNEQTIKDLEEIKARK